MSKYKFKAKPFKNEKNIINSTNENIEMKDIAEVEEISEILSGKLDDKKFGQNITVRNKNRNRSNVRLVSKEKTVFKATTTQKTAKEMY